MGSGDSGIWPLCKGYDAMASLEKKGENMSKVHRRKRKCTQNARTHLAAIRERAKHAKPKKRNSVIIQKRKEALRLKRQKSSAKSRTEFEARKAAKRKKKLNKRFVKEWVLSKIASNQDYSTTGSLWTPSHTRRRLPVMERLLKEIE